VVGKKGGDKDPGREWREEKNLYPNESKLDDLIRLNYLQNLSSSTKKSVDKGGGAQLPIPSFELRANGIRNSGLQRRKREDPS